jgi:flavodoxin-like protein
MRVVICYESMYGNTRQVAEAIATGVGPTADVTIEPIGAIEHMNLDDVDLLVAGAPTHAHGMSRPSTRKAAAEMAFDPQKNLTLEPGARGNGVREWLESLPARPGTAAAFDTRIRGPAWMMGSAAKGIARELRRQGFTVATKPMSFFVTKDNRLHTGELDRATAWGRELAGMLLPIEGPSRRQDA